MASVVLTKNDNKIKSFMASKKQANQQLMPVPNVGTNKHNTGGPIKTSINLADLANENDFNTIRGSNSCEGNSSIDTAGDVDQRLEQIITNKYLLLVSNQNSQASGGTSAKHMDSANNTPKVYGRKESMDTIVGAASRQKYGNK